VPRGSGSCERHQVVAKVAVESHGNWACLVGIISRLSHPVQVGWFRRARRPGIGLGVKALAGDTAWGLNRVVVAAVQTGSEKRV